MLHPLKGTIRPQIKIPSLSAHPYADYTFLVNKTFPTYWRWLWHCSAVKFQKYFVDLGNVTWLSISSELTLTEFSLCSFKQKCHRAVYLLLITIPDSRTVQYTIFSPSRGSVCHNKAKPVGLRFQVNLWPRVRFRVVLIAEVLALTWWTQHLAEGGREALH